MSISEQGALHMVEFVIFSIIFCYTAALSLSIYIVRLIAPARSPSLSSYEMLSLPLIASSLSLALFFS